MKKILFLVVFTISLSVVNAQDYNLGIRAGLNYSKFMGPLEEGEANSYSGGFHFGMSFAYNVTDLFAINSGLFYTQNGNKQHYEGDSFYLLRLEDDNIYEKGKSVIDIDVSNAYISIPLTANFFLTDKIEIYGGVYANILISPVGAGTWEFDSEKHPADIRFIQSLDHNYYSDLATEASNIGEPIIIWVNDTEYKLPKVSKAYYFFDEKAGDRFNVFDFGLTGGVSYYINNGFFLATRVSYGLTDTTNDEMDISIKELGENNEFIYTNDKDNHFGLEFSVGFRF